MSRFRDAAAFLLVAATIPAYALGCVVTFIYVIEAVCDGQEERRKARQNKAADQVTSQLYNLYPVGSHQKEPSISFHKNL